MPNHKTIEVEVPEEKRPDYFLRARLIVPADKIQKFLEAAAKILPTFETKTGFQLEVASLQEFEKKNATTGKVEKFFDVFHLWDIPDPDQLLRAMTFLGDFPAYLALDELVTFADQDIVVALPRLGVVGRRGYSEDDTSHDRRMVQRHEICGRSHHYPVVRVVDNFKKNQLDEILARYEEKLGEIEATSNMRLVGGFLNLTGDLNQIHWVWKLKIAPNERATFEPRQLPDRDLVDHSSVAVMTPAPYQHGFGGRAPDSSPGGEVLDYSLAAGKR